MAHSSGEYKNKKTALEFHKKKAAKKKSSPKGMGPPVPGSVLDERLKRKAERNRVDAHAAKIREEGRKSTPAPAKPPNGKRKQQDSWSRRIFGDSLLEALKPKKKK